MTEVHNVIDFQAAHDRYQEAIKEREYPDADVWQALVNSIRCIPTSHPTGRAVSLRNDPEMMDHGYTEYDLHEAFQFRTEMMEMFYLRHTDQRIETVIWAGLEFALEEMEKKDVSVCGIVVGTMRAMLASQQSFYPYFCGPVRHYPRRIEHVRADIESEKKRSRHLGYLEMELEDALEMEALAASGK